ncbi:hypothetical protein YC2023_027880 [Brassica napus]
MRYLSGSPVLVTELAPSSLKLHLTDKFKKSFTCELDVQATLVLQGTSSWLMLFSVFVAVFVTSQVTRYAFIQEEPWYRSINPQKTSCIDQV